MCVMLGGTDAVSSGSPELTGSCARQVTAFYLRACLSQLLSLRTWRGNWELLGESGYQRRMGVGEEMPQPGPPLGQI